jgi:hypothetical protein
MAGTSYEILVQPSTEPLTLADAKTYLRVDYDDEDTLIGQLITDARVYAQQVSKRSLASQTVRVTIEPPAIPEGALSGPVGGDFDPYRLNERITTVPFGFYGPMFPLPLPPVTEVTLVEYQLTPFDGLPTSTMQWTELPALDAAGRANYLLDTNTNPHKIALRPLLVANRYRITYTTGAAPAQYLSPIVNHMRSLISLWYDNRQGMTPQVQALFDSLTEGLARYRIFQL